MRRAWLPVLLLATCVLPSAAQRRATASAATDLSTISLGDRITLRVEVEHDSHQTIGWPELADTLGSFELVGAAPGDPVVLEGRQTSVMHYLLTTFELGELEIPPIEVAVADSGDSEPQLLSTQPIAVTVQSVGIDESGDIRNVKSPLELPRNWLLLVPWVILVGSLAGFAFWLYRRYQNRKRGTSERTVLAVPARPPHELAYEALERLEAKRLLDRGEIKQFFIEVSEIIRTYLEGRYPIDALEMTSYEVLRDLKGLGLEAEVYELFPPFFDRADLVKFAKFRPGSDVCHEMVPMARRLVDETRETEQPTAAKDVPVEGPAMAVAAAGDVDAEN